MIPLLHVHWFRRVRHPHGARHYGSYGQCRCGKRRAVSFASGYQPLDWRWVWTGEWSRDDRPPRVLVSR